MAVIDSRYSGVLRPLESSGTDDPTDTIRQWVAALSGLALDHVRRRWVPKPGTRPGIGENWVAVGIEEIETHGSPEQFARKGEIERPESGDVVRVSHQTLACAASFYGPDAAGIADTFREAAQLDQNVRWLASKGLKVQSVDGEATHVPDFLNEQWVDRYDVRFRIGRAVRRVFGVRDIAAVGDISIKTDLHLSR